jgi:acetylornithine deacetylase
MTDTAADLTAALVRIDSINPDLVPGGAGEAEIARFVAHWLGDRGLEVHTIEPRPGRPSIVGIARGRGGGRSLMLNAHMDTVGVEGMQAPFEPRIENGRLYGRGAYDMKGSLAACMVAGAAAAQEDLAGDVIVTAVADEEFASIGTQAVLEQHSADAAIVTEPTQLRACVAHKGFVWAELETAGRAAHGSRPDEGIDAITRMTPVLARLAALQRSLGDRPPHPLVGPPSIHASLIEGGQELSSYPARCLLSIERRTIPGETAQDAERECGELAGEDAEVRMGLVRDPFEVGHEEAVVRAVVNATGAELYGDTPWMDAALTQAAGIPTVVFGPSGAGAHAVEEWVDLASVKGCADTLIAVARELCT